MRLVRPQPIYAIRYCRLGWCHVPGVSFRRGGETGEFVAHVRYATDGRRGEDRERAHPCGALRVAVFGDSFVEALEVDEPTTFVRQLEDRLRAALPGRRVDVLNFGVSAYDTAQEWWYFRTEGARYQPDVVILVWTGESGSPFARLVDGRPVFVEPAFTAWQHWRRDATTFVKRTLHTATFLAAALGLNRSVAEFHQQVAHADTGGDGTTVPIGARPTVPFTPGWELQMALFETFFRETEQAGAALVVAALTRHQHAYLIEALRLRPIPGLRVIGLQRGSDEDEARHRFARDAHYNARGHARAASVLFETLHRERLTSRGAARGC